MSFIKILAGKLKTTEYLLLAIAVVFYLFFALYKLDEIPGEWFMDITILHIYVIKIWNGDLPHIFITSAGPLYPYLIAPFVALLGESYTTYKLLSVATGLLGVFGMYLYGKQASGSAHVGALAAIVTSISFMYLIWSRLGNFNIAVPVLTMFMGYFLLKYIAERKRRDLVGGIIVSSFGVLTYPGLFIMPPVFLLLLAYGLFTQRKKKSPPWRTLLLTLVSFIPVLVLFGYIVFHDFDNFTRGHIGSKVVKQDTSLQESLYAFGRNLYKTAGMLHIQGDTVFRVNDTNSPHLDRYSGILFLIGLVFLLLRKRKIAVYVLVPLIAFMLPGASPGLPESDMPNSARTLGTLPMTYLLVTFGLWAVYLFIKDRSHKTLALSVLCFILAVIFVLNVDKYFFKYAPGLPYHNTPSGKIIATEIDKLPRDTNIYVTACCWGALSQPEPGALFFVIKKKEKQKDMFNAYGLTDCKKVKASKNGYLIFNPYDTKRIDKFKKCFPSAKHTVHKANGIRIFTSLYVPQRK